MGHIRMQHIAAQPKTTKLCINCSCTLNNKLKLTQMPAIVVYESYLLAHI